MPYFGTVRLTLMGTKNIYENRRNPFVLSGTKNMVRVKLMCFLCFLPIHSGHQVRWTYLPGSHRRKVTQDFSSTFFLRCVPQFWQRFCFGMVSITSLSLSMRGMYNSEIAE